MVRLRSALLLAVSSLTFACGPHQEGGVDPCNGTATQPAACTQTCDQSVGAPNTCPGGFHCTPDGLCGQQCTQGGTECGSTARCSADGTCIDNPGGSAGPEPDAATCADLHFTATAIIPSIELLIDQSGSMKDNFAGGTGGESKYTAVHDALVGSTGVVTELESKIYFGAMLYTSGNTCPTTKATPRALSNLANIKSLIEANMPDSNTPTPEAINAVVADFAANPAPAGSPPIIVLATDGLPNTCDGTAVQTGNSVFAAGAAHFVGINLYILSVGDDVADQHLQDMANAGVGEPFGQNAPFYKGNDPASLQAAFQQIIASQISCDLTLNGMIDPAQASSGTVTLDGVTLTYGTDWTLTNPTTVTLTGTACTTLKTTPNPSVDATFPCGAGVLM